MKLLIISTMTWMLSMSAVYAQMLPDLRPPFVGVSVFPSGWTSPSGGVYWKAELDDSLHTNNLNKPSYRLQLVSGFTRSLITTSTLNHFEGPGTNKPYAHQLIFWYRGNWSFGAQLEVSTDEWMLVPTVYSATTGAAFTRSATYIIPKTSKPNIKLNFELVGAGGVGVNIDAIQVYPIFPPPPPNSGINTNFVVKRVGADIKLQWNKLVYPANYKIQSTTAIGGVFDWMSYTSTAIPGTSFMETTIPSSGIQKYFEMRQF